MGRFSIGPFIESRLNPIIQTFRDTATVFSFEKRTKDDGGVDCRLIFNKTKFGKVMLRMLPDYQVVEVNISHQFENPSDETSHCIQFNDCIKVHLCREDNSGLLKVVFEDVAGRHLEVTEEGKVYLGKILRWSLDDTLAREECSRDHAGQD